MFLSLMIRIWLLFGPRNFIIFEPDVLDDRRHFSICSLAVEEREFRSDGKKISMGEAS